MMTRKSFTLIELLIVVAIVGILAAIAVPNLRNALVRTKIARVESELHSLGMAIEMYRLDNHAVPPDGLDPENKLYSKDSWAMLVSPVSYISGVLPDVFQPDPSFFPEGELGRMRDRFPYCYNEPPWRPGMTMVGHGCRYDFRQSDWVIGSCGPDQKWMRADQAYYNPSNGLLSNGEMMSCQEGYLKPPKGRSLSSSMQERSTGYCEVRS